jgi:hypothetical protein
MFAEMMKDEIREKSLGGVRTKIGMGQPHGGNAPFGLRFMTKAELIAEAIARGEERPRRPGNEYRRVEKDMQLARPDLRTDRCGPQLARDRPHLRGGRKETASRVQTL